MEYPAELLYTSDHEWVRVEGDVATVGITAFATDQLGDIVYVEVETEGETLDRQEVFGSVEAVKTVADLYMPIAGEVIELNADLEDNPELVNQEPYGKGWMIKIRISESVEEAELLNVEAYQAELEKAQ
jgi:glycine cleavage system H protein